MADKPVDKNLLPALLTQNPAPVEKIGQDHKDKVRGQVDRIMQVFLQLLPSNYVSQVQGPFYTMQFQAAAERIAEFQITAQEAWSDRDYDFTRPEFLFQILGSLVFPDATTDGYPTLKGDLTYRAFLKRMVELLLQGSTLKTVEEGLDLLSDADFEIIERSLAARRTPNSAWGLDDQFTFEINVTETTADGQQTFPEEPFILSENVRIVLRALKPAHTLYDYRHLFRETFGQLFADTWSFTWSNYYYEDFRKFCCGAKNITGTAGATLTDRRLFGDATRDFEQVAPGADLVVLSGPNSIHVGGQEGTSASTDRLHLGRYRVEDVLAFPVGTDTTARAYTTSSGLSGKATVSSDVVEDAAQDFGHTVEGETLTFSEGPNAGTYRLKTLLGSNGGPVGTATGPASRVRVAKSLLRLDRRMGKVTSGQAYLVSVDRLGVQEPHAVQGEDATLFFVL